MKALYFDGQIRLVTDYPRPRKSKGEALVRVLKAGVCNTDLELMKGYMDFRGVPGHEFVGVVEEAEDAALVGRRVVGEINCPCGTCQMCLAGKGNHCPERSVLGITGRDGAFAEYLMLPEQNLHVVPDEVSDDEAVFVEPLAAAFRILEQVPVQEDDTAVVLGDGKLGLLVAQVMATKATKVLLVGRHEEKLRIAQQLGIDTQIEGQAPDIKSRFVVDCTGSLDGLRKAIQMAGPEGTVVVKSTVAEQSTLPMAQVVVNEVTLVGSRCGPFEPALEALRRKSVLVQPLITGRCSLDGGVEALKEAAQRHSLKIVIDVAPQ